VISAWRKHPIHNEHSRRLDIAFMLERQPFGAFSRKTHFVDFIQKIAQTAARRSLKPKSCYFETEAILAICSAALAISSGARMTA
jgi:hypothetical protein